MINEHDIKDFPESPYGDTVQLYTLRNKSFFKFPDSPEVYQFMRPDGMYSVCYNSKDELLHFAVFAEVIEVKDYVNV